MVWQTLIDKVPAPGQVLRRLLERAATYAERWSDHAPVTVVCGG